MTRQTSRMKPFRSLSRSAQLAACAVAAVLPFRGAAAEPPAAAASFAVTHLSHEEAIALALRNNQRIKVSAFGRGIARANVLTQYGRFDPALTFQRSYSENELPVSPNPLVSRFTKTDDYALNLTGLAPWGLTYQIGGTATNQRGTFNQFSDNYVTFGGVTVTQPLLRGFGFGANLADLRIAKADRAISDWQYRQTVIDTVTNVILAYDDLSEARENLRIALRSRELAAQLVRDNERRNQIGSLSDADVTQARARLASREEFILNAQRAVKDAENRLRELIGESKFAPNGPDLAVDALTPAPGIAVDGAGDYRRSLDLRPDYQMARQGIVKRRAGESAARNQLLPRVDFVGSYGYNGIDSSFARSRAQVRDEDHRAYSAGVVVSVPLTFAEGRGRARAAALGRQQAEADLVRLEQDIAVNVAAAIGQIETTAKRVEATTRAYELSQQALAAEEKRFRTGTSSTFVVLQLQEQLVAAQASQVRAIADQRRAIALYEREIGTTLAAHQLTIE